MFAALRSPRTTNASRSATRAALAAVTLFTLAACDSYGDDDDYDTTPTVPLPTSVAFSASGDLTAKLTEFRTALGADNGNTAGQQASGRREINWDGVPAIRTNTNDFPGNAFNSGNLRRGAVFSSPTGGLRVSDTDFGDIEGTYDNQFDDFSPLKTFMAVGSNVVDVAFQIAGDTAKARVKAFGVVFSDVDRAGSTVMEFFDAAGKKIGQVTAPVRSDAKGLSFAALSFQEAIVARVRITSGAAALAGGVKDVSDQGTFDLVVMDDYILSEPIAF